MHNKGDIIQIHCYKHNGKIHRVWEASTIIYETDDLLVCGNYKTDVTENDGRIHKTKEPALVFFYKHKWYNIVAQFKDFGLFYYCNIASPYIIEDNVLKYIDYDLDLRVFPDGGYRVLDKNEYKYHKKIMGYSEDLDMIINRELEELIKLKNEKSGPFDKNYLDYYYNSFLKLINK